MYGWRGRVGLIVPSSNTTNEPEFKRYLPAGVSLHTARMELEDATADRLTSMADDVERCGELLATANVDAVAYGCTTGSLVEGPGYDEKIEQRLADVTGATSVATAASIKRAFDALGVDQLSIVTPYVDDLNERERDFLEDTGYDVLAINGLGIKPNLDIGRQRPTQVYRQARQMDVSDADCLFVSCTNYRTFEIISMLEQDLGKPVITSNQATLWDVLGELNVDRTDIEAKPSLGELFEY